MSESVQQTYPYSVKIEEDSKGAAKVTVHVYHNDLDEARKNAVVLFMTTKNQLYKNGVKVLE